MDDAELIAAFTRNGDENAFRQLVQRRTGMVFGVCVRELGGDTARAEEAVQAVWIILARKAGQIRQGRALGAWLFRTARYTVAHMRRAEARRRKHEAEAAEIMADKKTDPAAEAWAGVRPHLDAVIDALPRRSREAVVLHCLEQRSQAETAQLLGCSVDAVEKRVAYGRERMAVLLRRRGVAVPAAILGAMLTAAAAEAAPAGLTVSAAAAALHTGAAAAGTALALAANVMKMMLWLRIKTAAAVLVILALACTAGVILPKGEGTGAAPGVSLLVRDARGQAYIALDRTVIHRAFNQVWYPNAKVFVPMLGQVLRLTTAETQALAAIHTSAWERMNACAAWADTVNDGSRLTVTFSREQMRQIRKIEEDVLLAMLADLKALVGTERFRVIEWILDTGNGPRLPGPDWFSSSSIGIGALDRFQVTFSLDTRDAYTIQRRTVMEYAPGTRSMPLQENERPIQLTEILWPDLALQAGFTDEESHGAMQDMRVWLVRAGSLETDGSPVPYAVNDNKGNPYRYVPLEAFASALSNRSLIVADREHGGRLSVDPVLRQYLGMDRKEETAVLELADTVAGLIDAMLRDYGVVTERKADGFILSVDIRAGDLLSRNIREACRVLEGKVRPGLEALFSACMLQGFRADQNLAGTIPVAAALFPRQPHDRLSVLVYTETGPEPVQPDALNVHLTREEDGFSVNAFLSGTHGRSFSEWGYTWLNGLKGADLPAGLWFYCPSGFADAAPAGITPGAHDQGLKTSAGELQKLETDAAEIF